MLRKLLLHLALSDLRHVEKTIVGLADRLHFSLRQGLLLESCVCSLLAGEFVQSLGVECAIVGRGLELILMLLVT